MSKAESIDTSVLSEQARLFSKYLIGKVPEEYHIRRYVDIISSSEESIRYANDKFLVFSQKYPRTVPYLDAYLAFKSPYGELRRRIYVMFAVLESSPAFWDDFLPKKRPLVYWVSLGYTGVRAIFRLVLGTILASFVKAQA